MLTIAVTTLSLINLTITIFMQLTLREHLRTLNAHSDHLGTCDRRLDGNHKAIMDLYERVNVRKT